MSLSCTIGYNFLIYVHIYTDIIHKIALDKVKLKLYTHTHTDEIYRYIYLYLHFYRYVHGTYS